MIWLAFEFDTKAITVTIPQEKLMDITVVVWQWSNKSQANIHELKTLLGKLFHVSQCCPPPQFFMNRMLHTLQARPPIGHIKLDLGFQKDIQCFLAYLPWTNGIFIISQEMREQVEIFLGACGTGCGAMCQPEAYHMVFPDKVLAAQRHI